MKITQLILISILLHCSVICFGQNFTSSAIPDNNGNVELFLRSYCLGSIQWQHKDISDTLWQDIEGANTNNYSLQASPENIENKEFRALVLLDPDTIPKYSYPFKIRAVSSTAELEVGDLYDGAFVYYSSNDTILGTYFLERKKYPWGCSGNHLLTNDSITYAIGSGQLNTQSIITDCEEENIAARVCHDLDLNGHDDWFLPSLKELESAIRTLANNRIFQIHMNFALSFLDNPSLGDTRSFWSSTEKIFIQTTVPGATAHFAVNRSGSGVLTSHSAKLTEYEVLPSRQYVGSESSSLCETILYPRQFNNIGISIQEESQKVTVQYIGPDLGESEINWNFGQAQVLSGIGTGPYELYFQFGGYSQVHLNVIDQDCGELNFHSEIFRTQLFEEMEVDFPEVYDGFVMGVDYNNDGWQDVFITGSDTTVLYENISADSFKLTQMAFPSRSKSHASWGDYNNDNLIDLILCGLDESGMPRTQLFANQGSGDFSEIDFDIPDIYDGVVEFFDYNNDGILDLIISGKNQDEKPVTELFVGDENEGFVSDLQSFPQVLNSVVSIVDYNKDNYLDILLTGKRDSTRMSLLMKNVNGLFEQTDLDLVGIDNGEVAWMDFNEDGLLDFYSVGSKVDIQTEYNGVYVYQVIASPAAHGVLMIQTEDGRFEEFVNPYTSANLLRFSNASAKSGDFNNDGRDDLLVTGIPTANWAIGGSVGPTIQDPDDWNRRSKPLIFRNIGDGFVNAEPDIPSTYSVGGSPSDDPYVSQGYSHSIMGSFECSSIAFADFNGDGNLDILREGRNQEFASSVYLNKVLLANDPPSIPIVLSSTVINCDTVLLEWSQVEDDHTLNTSLVYEIYIGTQPGASDIFSMKNERQIRNTFFQVNDLKDGQYFWGVKAVDNAKNESTYSEEHFFEINCISSIIEDDISQKVHVQPNPFFDAFNVTVEGSNEHCIYSVIDELGRAVTSGTFRNSVEISSDDLEGGVYFLKLYVGNEIVVRKLVSVR